MVLATVLECDIEHQEKAIKTLQKDMKYFQERIELWHSLEWYYNILSLFSCSKKNKIWLNRLETWTCKKPFGVIIRTNNIKSANINTLIFLRCGLILQLERFYGCFPNFSITIFRRSYNGKLFINGQLNISK